MKSPDRLQAHAQKGAKCTVADLHTILTLSIKFGWNWKIAGECCCFALGGKKKSCCKNTHSFKIAHMYKIPNRCFPSLQSNRMGFP